MSIGKHKRNIRKILVVTGSRADYGHLYPIMKEIEGDKNLKLQIIATGTHLSGRFGNTFREIEKDGFKIDCKIRIPLNTETPQEISRSFSAAMNGCTKVFCELKPDIVMILGDRYEILAAAQAAMFAGIPVAHIHGGEITEGAIDEYIRHAITKMSHLHFAAAEPYRKRIIQMGETPSRVYCTGAPCIDNILNTRLLERLEIEDKLSFSFGKINFLVTYHPETLNPVRIRHSVEELLKALDSFPEARIIFTKHNADAGGKIIGDLIERYVAVNHGRVKIFASLGNNLYLSLVNNVNVVIGNSSSGLIEVPIFKKPTVNIGIRQEGRLKSPSVIDCRDNSQEISAAIRKALNTRIKKIDSPYYFPGGASKKIKDIIKSVKLDQSFLRKKFHDL